MNRKIIVDSGCDLTPEMKKEMDIVSVPLTMRLGEKEFIDDENLDIPGFLEEMGACTDRAGSASPSPYSYREAIRGADDAFVVTLSSRLSGSYDSAAAGRDLAEEEGQTNTHVIDSKSASAGETLVALKLHEILKANLTAEKILQAIEAFISNMKTYFVLENYDNLQKNGRLNKITGKLIQLLNVKLIMGSDRSGNIALYKRARGIGQMTAELLRLIEESGKETAGAKLVISHCDNPDLANRLSDAIRQRFHFDKIFVVHTGGLSSLYADRKGVVLAF